MAKRTTFTIEKGAEGTVSEAAIKVDVVRQTVQLAKAEERASMIKEPNGRIQEERTYPRRSDAHRTEG
jgi:hypothetical protein